jgi:hypothetical protein
MGKPWKRITLGTGGLLANAPSRRLTNRVLLDSRQRGLLIHAKAVIAFVLVLGVLTGVARAADPPTPDASTIARTPPRLSFVDGQVSFWRPGAQDWAQAQINTPLAPGDELATASPGNLEVQIGARAFVRTWANTQVGLANQEPDFLQFKVTAGTASFDLRSIEPGHTVEVDTPNAAFTIERAGYYRVDVTGERTALIIRRGGRATMTPPSGEATVIAPSEEVVIEGTSSPQVASYASPPLDAWDRWNYARTDHLLDAVSARYVSPEAYGVSELDRSGAWRVVPTYGSVWVPTGMPGAWAPYSTGSWTLDPFYGWTWVDTAPWGWAPYHYGRWVFVDGFWAWAPGPVLVRPVYAPALVAFFGGPSASVSVSIGGPVVGWVALGWGEPVVPWWGPAGFIHEPSWRGWGGPRVVNNTVINNTTVVNVQNITVYRNTNVQNAVVAVNEQHFGHGPITPARVADVKNLQPTHTAPQIAATPASFVPTASRGVPPPAGSLQRSVVATRSPRAGSDTAAGGARQVGPAGVSRPAPRLVSVPSQRESVSTSARPAFGHSTVERPTEDRTHPPSPPGAPKPRASLPQPPREPQSTGPTPKTPQPSPSSRAAVPPPPAGHREPATVTAPAPTAPQTSASRPTVPPPPGRRPEPPAVTAPAPAAPQPSPSRVAAPRPPARHPEVPQVAAPAPTAPQPSPRPAPTAPQPSPSRVAAPPPPARRPEAPQAPASASAGPQSAPSRATAPPPGAPRPSPPQVAAPAAPQPPAHRAETPRSPTRPLPGEPANRLAPNRGPDVAR